MNRATSRKFMVRKINLLETLSVLCRQKCLGFSEEYRKFTDHCCLSQTIPVSLLSARTCSDCSVVQACQRHDAFPGSLLSGGRRLPLRCLQVNLPSSVSDALLLPKYSSLYDLGKATQSCDQALQLDFLNISSSFDFHYLSSDNSFFIVLGIVKKFKMHLEHCLQDSEA